MRILNWAAFIFLSTVIQAVAMPVQDGECP